MPEETHLIDLIRDEHTLNPQEDHSWLQPHIEALDVRERQLLQLRHLQDQPCSYARAACVMGVDGCEGTPIRVLATVRGLRSNAFATHNLILTNLNDQQAEPNDRTPDR